MGQEIEGLGWRDEDFARFTERLKAETDLIEQWEREGRLSEAAPDAGHELEAWLVDADMQPAPMNAELIAALDDGDVVPELARYNIEYNAPPCAFAGRSLSSMEKAMEAAWQRSAACARDFGLTIALCGILPTLESRHLSREAMSAGNRYRALDEHVFRLRKGRPIRLSIEGRERLDDEHRNVMLEAAATSFQLHMTVPASRSADWYNAAKLAAAPVIAAGANAPFLFGRDLWAETRIPLFEGAVSVGDWDYAERVTFGVRFIEKGLSEVFLANRQRYPVLMPMLADTPVEAMAHMKLHSGTIWRWVRPIVGRDADRTPHYRIEQRVLPAGPTIADMIANAAFGWGLTAALANSATAPHERCQFFTTRDNFYAAAREGLEARLRWDHVDDRPATRLICDIFVPMAAEGLGWLGVDAADIAHYLGIITDRAASGINGAAWQRAWVERNGRDMAGLTRAMIERQADGAPVHRWGV